MGGKKAALAWNTKNLRGDSQISLLLYLVTQSVCHHLIISLYHIYVALICAFIGCVYFSPSFLCNRVPSLFLNKQVTVELKHQSRKPNRSIFVIFCRIFHHLPTCIWNAIKGLCDVPFCFVLKGEIIHTEHCSKMTREHCMMEKDELKL